MDIIKIGEFLKNLRVEKGLTQSQLAETIGSTNKTVSRWETGTYLPPVEMLLILSDFYGVTVNEILLGKKTNNSEINAETSELLLDVISDSKYVIKSKEYEELKKWLFKHIPEFIIEIILLIIGINIFINLDINSNIGIFFVFIYINVMFICYLLRIHVYLKKIIYGKSKHKK